MGDVGTVKVVIVGAGLGGISTAIKLKSKLGFTNFTIYEKASDIGGTWRDNTYPGCACDVPSHWYSLSSELNPEWTHYFANQPEIFNYWRALTMKHELYHKIVFNTCVTSQTWDADAQAWNIEIETTNSANGTTKREIVKAQLVVSAAGGLSIPNYSSIQCLGDFKGAMFHSARWDSTIDLMGKRVGVIGNGCSAVQFIPEISKNPSVQVINFCRTPSWFVPRPQYKYSAIAKWIFRHIPFTARLYRIFLATISDLGFVIWRKNNTWLRGMAEKDMLHHMRKHAPKKYHEELTPKYPAGCKRIIVDAGYYDALHRPNVQLHWGGIERAVEDGVITTDGEKHELDVLILGTGFLFIDSKSVRILGKGGKSLFDYFESRGGPEAYLGTTFPGFPNYFCILGPNVASGHASAIFAEEQQMEYAIQLMQPVIEGKARSFEVREDVSHAFNDDLQRRLGETTWSSCRSYYRVGDNNMGKIIATFPGPVAKLWYLTRKVGWGDYIGVDAERWEAERRKMAIVRWGLVPLLVAGACVGMREYRAKRYALGDILAMISYRFGK